MKILSAKQAKAVGIVSKNKLDNPLDFADLMWPKKNWKTESDKLSASTGYLARCIKWGLLVRSTNGVFSITPKGLGGLSEFEKQSASS